MLTRTVLRRVTTVNPLATASRLQSTLQVVKANKSVLAVAGVAGAVIAFAPTNEFDDLDCQNHCQHHVHSHDCSHAE